MMSSQIGEVLVSEELVEFLGTDTIDAAVGQLRLSGGNCWSCEGTIHHVDDVSLILHKTPVGGKIGFLHLRCGPPQILDSGRNRRAAIAFESYFRDRSTDAQAFAVVRNYPYPHALLVVSQEASFSAREENGDVTSPWLNLCIEAGLITLCPDVFDASPALVDGWSLRIEGDKVVCGSPRGPLYEGSLETPADWLEALAQERRCIIFVTGLGVNSDTVGDGFEPALNLLASRGLVAGGAVKVDGLLGLHAAMGMASAAAEARLVETLTGLQRPGDSA